MGAEKQLKDGVCAQVISLFIFLLALVWPPPVPEKEVLVAVYSGILLLLAGVILHLYTSYTKIIKGLHLLKLGTPVNVKK